MADGVSSYPPFPVSTDLEPLAATPGSLHVGPWPCLSCGTAGKGPSPADAKREKLAYAAATSFPEHPGPTLLIRKRDNLLQLRVEQPHNLLRKAHTTYRAVPSLSQESLQCN